MGNHTHKILVVDDDPYITKLIKLTLDGKGFDTRTAGDGFEALESFRSFEPCLLILDLSMPEMSGEDVLKKLNLEPRFRKARTIILTATDSVASKTECLARGADDYIIKPFQPEEFIARVKAQLRSNELLETIEEEKERYLDLSFKDALTGLYNRRYLEEFVLKEWAISQRQKTPLTCVMLDIDHFKEINDTHSHEAGDLVLKKISEIIKEGIRCADMAARYGGEEFLLLLNNTTLEGAKIAMEGLREKVERTVVTHENTEIKVTISAGIAGNEQEGMTSSKELVRCADKALYAAKAGGRNQVRVYEK